MGLIAEMVDCGCVEAKEAQVDETDKISLFIDNWTLSLDGHRTLLWAKKGETGAKDPICRQDAKRH